MRALFIGALSLYVAGTVAVASSAPEWSPQDLKRIQSISIASLPLVPLDPSNRVADDPSAAALGKALFFDTSLSGNGSVSCASCHKPDRQYQDDLPAGHGMAIGTRRTMPIAGTAYMPFLFWDGRKDSQWSQALGPLENPLEHGADRTMVALHVAERYMTQYEKLFGPLPNFSGLPAHAAPSGNESTVKAWQGLSVAQQANINRVFANTGKAIAAFERTLTPQSTKFDAYAAALARQDAGAAATILTSSERNGLKLFIGKANCLNCHNGPLLTDNAFHNIGLPTDTAEAGRSTAVREILADPFNCLGVFSDAGSDDCGELRFMETKSHDLVGAFRSPSLRGVSQRPPYTHAAHMKTIRNVLVHYNKAPAASVGHSELRALKLNDQELADLEAFLGTLNGP